MRIKSCFTFALALMVGMAASTTRAGVYVPGDDNDSWVGLGDAAPRQGDSISVWSVAPEVSPPFPRYGIVAFDLAPIRADLNGSPLSEVHFSLYQQLFGFSDDFEPIKQFAYLIDPRDENGSIAPADLSFQDINLTILSIGTGDENATLMETLGSLTEGPTNLNPNVFVDSTASTADRAALQAVIDDTNRTSLIFALLSDESNASLIHRKSWSDGEAGGFDPRLSINQAIDNPIAGDFNGDGNVTIADFVVMKNNWVSIGNVFNTNGEVTSDGLVSLADYALFKNTLFPGGASAFTAALEAASAVPEPSTLMLLLATVPAWLVARPRWRKT